VQVKKDPARKAGLQQRQPVLICCR